MNGSRTPTARAAHPLPDRLRDLATGPGDPDYQRLRHTYSHRGSPALVLAVETDEDVVAALAHARERGGPLSVRSGGHGISSRSTNDGGVVIDLSSMHAVEVLDREQRLVRVQAGATWGEVATQLAPHGLAITSGDSGDVGVGGLATTGGIGLLGRRFGLTIDHVVGATVVTADGQVLQVDADHHPDLFWAIRGAGGNVGIVTEFTMRAAVVPAVAHATLAYDARDAAALLAGWGAAMASAPRDVTGFLYLFGGGGGPASAMASIVVTTADADTAQRLLEPFAQVAPLQGARATLARYDAVVQRSGAPHTGSGGSVTRSALVPALDTATARVLAGLLDGGAADGIQLRALGGAINDVPAEATAFAHRQQAFSVMAVTSPARRADLWAAWEEVRDHADGLYLSFETDDDPRRIMDAFPPATLTRLRRIKARWDPDDVFSHNFDVALGAVPGAPEGS
ncbi:FAD-binding oxidoreductase [Modestobacter roseus]|uniref:FAD-binding oxidoreductase n=1 Tax=Modestobacter roseus TaxID=1181884 RepID=UPI0034E01A63